MFKETYEYEFENDDCTVEKEITVGKKEIREAIEFILEEKEEKRINEVAKNMFDAEEIEGLNLDEIKGKIAWQGAIDLLADWFYDELKDWFEDAARDGGKVISADFNSDYVNDYNAGMAYYRANC